MPMPCTLSTWVLGPHVGITDCETGLSSARSVCPNEDDRSHTDGGNRYRDARSELGRLFDINDPQSKVWTVGCIHFCITIAT